MTPPPNTGIQAQTLLWQLQRAVKEADATGVLRAVDSWQTDCPGEPFPTCPLLSVCCDDRIRKPHLVEALLKRGVPVDGLDPLTPSALGAVLCFPQTDPARESEDTALVELLLQTGASPFSVGQDIEMDRDAYLPARSVWEVACARPCVAWLEALKAGGWHPRNWRTWNPVGCMSVENTQVRRKPPTHPLMAVFGVWMDGGWIPQTETWWRQNLPPPNLFEVLTWMNQQGVSWDDPADTDGPETVLERWKRWSPEAASRVEASAKLNRCLAPVDVGVGNAAPRRRL